MDRRKLILWSIPVMALVTGCASALETGYEPRPLGSSSAVRRGYYASPFTPEAKAAEMEREQELDARRPHPGY